MSTWSQVILVGRLTKTPDVKHLEGGSVIAKFSIAVDKWVPDGADKQANFFNCVAFAKTATFIEKYIDKGRMVMVVGEPDINQWTDGEGNKRRDFQVKVQTVKTLDKRPEGSGENGSSESSESHDETTAPAAAPAQSGIDWEED